MNHQAFATAVLKNRLIREADDLEAMAQHCLDHPWRQAEANDYLKLAQERLSYAESISVGE